MPTKVAFAEVDITPPPGTRKMGWLKGIVADRVLDPLFAKVAVFDAGGQRVALVQLDTCFVAADDVAEIRRRTTERHGLPGGNVMIAATHNHAGQMLADAAVALIRNRY